MTVWKRELTAGEIELRLRKLPGTCAHCGKPVRRQLLSKHRQYIRAGRPPWYPPTCSRRCFNVYRTGKGNPHLRRRRVCPEDSCPVCRNPIFGPIVACSGRCGRVLAGRLLTAGFFEVIREDR